MRRSPLPALIAALLAAPVALPAARVPWTTSRLTGSPNPPAPYRAEPAFPHLHFSNPVEMIAVPGKDEWFVAELGGKLFHFAHQPGVRSPELVADLKANLPRFDRLLGFQFHPRFAENRQIFICYNNASKAPDGSRIARFTVRDTRPPTLDYASERVIITWPSGGHNGCSIHFGPDGYLYFSTGDAEAPNPPDPFNTGQDISDLLGGVMRIDVDREEAGRAYRVPPDNPFVNTPNARPEVWAYGMRNPWRMSFNDQTGELLVGDVGWELWEMIYRVERGGNYGWSIVEGPQPVKPGNPRGPTPILQPLVSHSHVEAMSITGGYVYRGPALPELRGAYLHGDWVTGKIWALRHDGAKVTLHQEIADTAIQIVCFAKAPEGEVLVVDYQGGIFRLIKNSATASRDFPRRLSETGLFADVAGQQPAPGVVAYQPAATQWMDGVRASRWVALPGVTRLGIWRKNEPYQGRFKDHWSFPTNGVLARTLEVELEAGNPASARKLETQVLHHDGEEWNAFSYHWNDAQTDAELAGPDGHETAFTIRDANAPGGRRTLKWRFASRAECLTCHTTKSGYVSAFRPELLGPGSSGSQLAALTQLGLFEEPPKAKPAPPPRSRDAELERWVRRYLDVNCSHCHQQGAGGTATIVLREDVPLDRARLLDALPSQGDFGIRDARIVAPGDPSRSVLLYRIAKTGSGRMPHIGSHDVDAGAVQKIAAWIQGFAPENGGGLQAKDTAWKETGAALQLAVSLASAPGQWRPENAARVREAPPNVRDLFERFLPEDQRRRTLGTDIQPARILALPADWRRGQALFFQTGGGQCANCHRVQNLGREVGPDLTQIGRKYSAAQLLEHILKPSVLIEPAFAAISVETNDGESITGYLVRQEDGGYTVRDAAGRDHHFRNAQVRERRPLQLSLMPEGLLQGHTAQEAADLIAYLESLR